MAHFVQLWAKYLVQWGLNKCLLMYEETDEGLNG